MIPNIPPPPSINRSLQLVADPSDDLGRSSHGCLNLVERQRRGEHRSGVERRGEQQRGIRSLEADQLTHHLDRDRVGQLVHHLKPSSRYSLGEVLVGQRFDVRAERCHASGDEFRKHRAPMLCVHRRVGNGQGLEAAGREGKQRGDAERAAVEDRVQV